MKTQKATTRVKFLIHEIQDTLHGKPCTWESDLFAYFPDDHHEGSALRTCYSHTGQHSPCSPEYANDSRQANPDEYADLRAEIESLGYKLEII